MKEEKKGMNIITIFFIAAVAYAVLPPLNSQEICNEESIQIK